eukprot:4205811-Prymnesium_polylepis.1
MEHGQQREATARCVAARRPAGCTHHQPRLPSGRRRHVRGLRLGRLGGLPRWLGCRLGMLQRLAHVEVELRRHRGAQVRQHDRAAHTRVVCRALVGHLAAEETFGRRGVPGPRDDLLTEVAPAGVDDEHGHRAADVCHEDCLHIAKVLGATQREQRIANGEAGATGGRFGQRLLIDVGEGPGAGRCRVRQDLGRKHILCCAPAAKRGGDAWHWQHVSNPDPQPLRTWPGH